MDIKVEKLPKSRVKLTIKVSPIAMGEYFSRALDNLALNFNLPGFRPGKAPLPLVEQKIGDEKIAAEALEIALPINYQKAIEQEKIIPLETPKVNIKEFGKGKALEFEAEVDVMPEIKLGDYKKIKMKKTAPEEVKEQNIETVLKQLQRQTSDLKLVDRPAKKEDFVEIDFEAHLGDKPLSQGKSQNHPVIIGQGQFIPEFEEKLVGMKKGEEKKFSVKFPENFHNKELAGKEVSFKVLMKEIKEIELPKMDDAWAAKLGKKDLKELKKSIKESLEKEEQKKAEEKLEQEVIEKVAQICETEIPESLVLAETERVFTNLIYQVQSKGLKFEDYLKSLKKTQEELIKELRVPAEQNVKVSLILGEITRRENIKVSEKEIEEEIKKLESQNIKIEDETKKRIENMLAIRKTVKMLTEISK